MVGSLVGYFFYIVAAFATTMALLIRLSDDSTVEKALHYPHPVIVETVTASKGEDRRQPVALGMTGGRSVRVSSATEVKTSRTASVAKAEHDKSRLRKFAQLGPLKALHHQRDDYQDRPYRLALGYAGAPGYRPGLDSQR